MILSGGVMGLKPCHRFYYAHKFIISLHGAPPETINIYMKLFTLHKHP